MMNKPPNLTDPAQNFAAVNLLPGYGRRRGHPAFFRSFPRLRG
jgi:hypothetical protein